MERELRMTRILTDLCHEVTEAVRDKEELIEEVKELGVAAQGSDSMAYLRILRVEDLAKENDIMNLIKETQKHTREKYVYIAKAVRDKEELIEEVKELGVAAQGSDSMAYLRILRVEDLTKENDIMNLIKETQKHTRENLYVLYVKVCGMLCVGTSDDLDFNVNYGTL
nr:hypothetical protein [Tanacetum cinerariifolium]